MKRVILLAAVIFAGWHYFNEYAGKGNGQLRRSSGPFEEGAANSFTDTRARFQCDGREYCSQMSSYEEAKFFIENCPNTKMDGDGDGIPCERQFGR